MTLYQQQILKKKFLTKTLLEMREKYQLARSLNVSERAIEYWFLKTHGIARQERLTYIGE